MWWIKTDDSANTRSVASVARHLFDFRRASNELKQVPQQSCPFPINHVMYYHASCSQASYSGCFAVATTGKWLEQAAQPPAFSNDGHNMTKYGPEDYLDLHILRSQTLCSNWMKRANSHTTSLGRSLNVLTNIIIITTLIMMIVYRGVRRCFWMGGLTLWVAQST